MRKIKTSLQSKNSLVIKNNQSQAKVDIEDIIYAEVYGKKLMIHTKKKGYEIVKTLKSLMNEISEEDFVQISKSAVINLSYVEKMSVAFSGNYYVYFTTNHHMTVSRRYVSTLKKQIEKRWKA